MVLNIYSPEDDLAHDKRCARLRRRLIESGQIVPAPPGPRFMTVEDTQAWKAKLLRNGLLTPRHLRMH